MKHLFIINPMAGNVKGQHKEIVTMIDTFFENYKDIEYKIHVTRWCRDAVGFVHRFLLGEKDIVRVYAVGGTGTLFEIINGTIGMPNVQIASYPLGYTNSFIRYFGSDKKHLFLSLKNLVFSETTSIDLIRCGRHYGVSHSSIGLETESASDIHNIINKTKLDVDVCYLIGALLSVKKVAESKQQYDISPMVENSQSGFTTLLVANTPFYGKSFSPAIDAHPNDSLLDVYITKKMPAWKILTTAKTYLSGNYNKFPERISHFQGTNLRVTSEEVMRVSVDGEMFYETSVDFEVLPYAVDFVCPRGIDTSKI